MKKAMKITLWIMGSLMAAAVLFILYQNDYEMTEKSVRIETPQGILTGTLVLPEEYSGKVQLVVFVHGDGPINADHEEGYRPLWEVLATNGYASLSLNKPGIGGAPGNWLDQSMEDRAQEIQYAIEWAQTLSMIDADNIGLWGASQAGWVIPKVVRENRHIAFSILVSPAVNWITQGQFNTKEEMKQAGISAQEIMRKEKYNQQVLNLLKAGASYKEYLSIADPEHVITEERWTFISKNVKSDATAELTYFNSPVLLVLGGKDINVDVEETEQVYRKEISAGLLTVVKIPEADHSMMNEPLADSQLLTVMTALFAPGKLTNTEYLNSISGFVTQQKAD
ncbi:alpha/beta hydrolase [Paenibacillus sp. FSL L8-0470]|uniref:alpha/beta hydrolase family protein n=1 Tax=Paenibacillus sp. FSL L8-0470 TaxID=2954688 RepID=UPI0030FB3DF6